MKDPKFTVTVAKLDCYCDCGHGKYHNIETFTAYAKNATLAIQKCENYYAKKNHCQTAEVAILAVKLETGPIEWSGPVTEI